MKKKIYLILIGISLIFLSCDESFDRGDIKNIYYLYPNPIEIGDTLTVHFGFTEGGLSSLNDVVLFLEKKDNTVSFIQVTGAILPDTVGTIHTDSVLDSSIIANPFHYVQGVLKDENFPGGMLFLELKGKHTLNSEQKLIVNKKGEMN
jgi:hypothetical protein